MRAGARKLAAVPARVLAGLLAGVLTGVLIGAPPAGAQGPAVQVGSKKFTESVILGELAARLIRQGGAPARHRRQLGGTRLLWNALRSGELDVYPDYTGTIAQEILAGEGLSGEAQIRRALARRGIRMSRPLGFNNTYAIGVKRALAERLGLRRISDLIARPDLRLGFTNEFMSRRDGWPGLRGRYRLPQRGVRGLDHDLAYRALEAGTIQATDLYSTDAEIAYYGLRVLEDDLGFFPAYQAVLLYRADLERRAPAAVHSLLRLEGRIPAGEMIRMNARAKLDKVPEGKVAAEFLARALGVRSRVAAETLASRLWRNTADHLFLVGVSLGAAIAAGLPLGVMAARLPALGQAVLAAVGVVQTIPSLALLVFMIPLLGIGGPPAIMALFLYSLLPIVRNTYAGLHGIPAEIRESAEAIGLPPATRLRVVEIPMALPTILAGIKTSAVINVGTATLGALIGAGGYGQPILTGIRLDDVGLILEGAVPAAALALAVQGAFDLAERLLVSRGLRIAPGA